MYETHYTIGNVKHVWKTDNMINEQGVIEFTPLQNYIVHGLLKALKVWIGIAKQHDIKWFALSGTLLGAIRQHGIIPLDDDIDLGVTIDDYQKLNQLTTIKIDDNYHIEKSDCGFRFFNNNIRFPFIDIFVMAKDPKDKSRMIYAGPFYNDEPRFYVTDIFEKEWIPVKWVNNLKTAKFEDMEIPVPKRSAEYLKRVYGKDCLTRYVKDTRIQLLHNLLMYVDWYKIEYVILTVNNILRLDTHEDRTKHMTLLLTRLLNNVLVERNNLQQTVVNMSNNIKIYCE
jgi:hypothetical protein